MALHFSAPLCFIEPAPLSSNQARKRELSDSRTESAGLHSAENHRARLHESSLSNSISHPRHRNTPCLDEAFLQILCKDGKLDRAMDVLSGLDAPPSISVYLSLLKLCNRRKSMVHTKLLQEHLVQNNICLTGYIGDYLVVTLANTGAVEDAWQMACKLPNRTVFSWTALISANVESGNNDNAFRMYQCMREEGIQPDNFTYVSLLKACGRTSDLARGKHLHEEAQRMGLASDIFVGNSLVSMYGKCGDIIEAENVFISMSHRDIVSWTAMLSVYIKHGYGEKVLRAFRQMIEEGVEPNHLTCTVVLQACITLAENEDATVTEATAIKQMSLDIGIALHAYVKAKDLEKNAFVGTTLLTLYGKCGDIKRAEAIFGVLERNNIVSWNAIMSAYVDQGHGKEALLLFKQMQEEGISPDALSFVFAIQACAIVAEEETVFISDGKPLKIVSLTLGLALHMESCINDFISDAFVETTLVTMYGKCGALNEAEDVFKTIPQRDVVSWTAMFSAYVEQGLGNKALALYKEMQEHQLEMDDVTLMLSCTALLSGLVEEGKGDKAVEMYKHMKKQSLAVDDVALNCVLQACTQIGSLEMCNDVHFDVVCSGYDCMLSVAATLVHGYGSCGSITDAEAIFDSIPEPDVVSLTACIAGHAGLGKYALCVDMLERAKCEGIKPDEITCSAVLSACCHSGLVDKGLMFFESMVRDYNVTPDLKHYSIMLDLFARAGIFSHIESMLKILPVQLDLAFWLSLLGSCRTHGNVDLARRAFDNSVSLHPKQAAAYILMSNIYLEAGLEDCAIEVEIISRKAGISQEAWAELD